MTAHFLRLEWKQYFRASYWEKSIGIKILMGFLALYFIGLLMVMGFELFNGLKNSSQNKTPLPW